MAEVDTNGVVPADVVEDDVVEQAGEAAAADAAPPKRKAVYFIRVPRPQREDKEDEIIKALQEKVSAQITKLKKLNQKLAEKRVRGWGGKEGS